jgi:hypothetical protein
MLDIVFVFIRTAGGREHVSLRMVNVTWTDLDPIGSQMAVKLASFTGRPRILQEESPYYMLLASNRRITSI